MRGSTAVINRPDVTINLSLYFQNIYTNNNNIIKRAKCLIDSMKARQSLRAGN